VERAPIIDRLLGSIRSGLPVSWLCGRATGQGVYRWLSSPMWMGSTSAAGPLKKPAPTAGMRRVLRSLKPSASGPARFERWLRTGERYQWDVPSTRDPAPSGAPGGTRPDLGFRNAPVQLEATARRAELPLPAHPILQAPLPLLSVYQGPLQTDFG
jgi:hypothetical protein